jgi:tetratricopeptide (TPR) repeat protein
MCFVGVRQTAQPATPHWLELLNTGHCKDAEDLCTGWLTSTDKGRQVEAYKCLANAALCGNTAIRLEGDDAGGGTMSEDFQPEAIDKALGYLNQALKLAPQDLSIHQGRLHLLEISFRVPEMASALDESCRVYKGPHALDAWLAYTDEFFQDKRYRAALTLLEVLDRHYPDSHEVQGNMGAMHMALKEDDKALVYLLKAVELAPSDPIDTWNLAREYDFTDKTELADALYQKAIALDSDAGRRRTSTCAYATFVEQKLRDAKRACELQKTACPVKEQTACQGSK